MQQIQKCEKENKIAIQIIKGYKCYGAFSGIIEISSDSVVKLAKTYDSQETISEEKTESDFFKNTETLHEYILRTKMELKLLGRTQPVFKYVMETNIP